VRCHWDLVANRSGRVRGAALNRCIEGGHPMLPPAMHGS